MSDAPAPAPVFDSDLIRQIQALEGRQLRAMREAWLMPADLAAQQRVRAIDDQIDALRQRLQKNRVQTPAPPPPGGML